MLPIYKEAAIFQYLHRLRQTYHFRVLDNAVLMPLGDDSDVSNTLANAGNAFGYFSTAYQAESPFDMPSLKYQGKL